MGLLLATPLGLDIEIPERAGLDKFVGDLGASSTSCISFT